MFLREREGERGGGEMGRVGKMRERESPILKGFMPVEAKTP